MLCPKFGWLCNYQTGLAVRAATRSERAQSILASYSDGGIGVIRINGIAVYVS